MPALHLYYGLVEASYLGAYVELCIAISIIMVCYLLFCF